MNRVSWKEITELVGIAAIVVGLVFVGIQLQQDRRIAVSALGSDGSARSIAISQLIAENIDVWVRAMDGENLTAAEDATFQVVASAVHAGYLDMFNRSYQLGGFSPTSPKRIAQNYAYFIYSYPGYKRFWSQRHERFSGRNSVFGREPFIEADVDASNFFQSVSDELNGLERAAPTIPENLPYTP